MPNTREKLIELLSQVQYLGGLEEKVADHLIANDVTVLDCKKDCANCWKTKLVNAPNRWIPVTERLPRGLGPVLICTASKMVAVARIRDGNWYISWNMAPVSLVTHWMPLPEPPKEE